MANTSWLTGVTLGNNRHTKKEIFVTAGQSENKVVIPKTQKLAVNEA